MFDFVTSTNLTTCSVPNNPFVLSTTALRSFVLVLDVWNTNTRSDAFNGADEKKRVSVHIKTHGTPSFLAQGWKSEKKTIGDFSLCVLAKLTLSTNRMCMQLMIGTTPRSSLGGRIVDVLVIGTHVRAFSSPMKFRTASNTALRTRASDSPATSSVTRTARLIGARVLV
jgi:hypothetical protein